MVLVGSEETAACMRLNRFIDVLRSGEDPDDDEDDDEEGMSRMDRVEAAELRRIRDDG